MGFKMKPVKRNLADEFHRDSVHGIDAVFERMFKAAGNPLGYSFAEAFDVSENTLKTWRRRGAVSTKFLQGFAAQYGVSLDYLLHGVTGDPDLDIARDANERVLLERFRSAPKNLRDAALRVLITGESGSAVQTVNDNRGQVTQAGDIVVRRRRKSP